jgi:hypothetical protein
MAEETNDQRRRFFLETAAITIAATQLGIIGYAAAQRGHTSPADPPKIMPGTNTSFASVKQIQAGALNMGYAEAGPADGPAAILSHGWRYDIYT